MGAVEPHSELAHTKGWDVILGVLAVAVVGLLFVYNRQPYTVVSWVSAEAPRIVRTHEEYLLVNCLLLLLPVVCFLSAGGSLSRYYGGVGSSWGWLVAAGCYLFMLPLLWWAAGRVEFQQMYPLYRLAKQSWGAFGYHLVTYTFYLWCWELFFRGVVTSIAWRWLGWGGVTLQALAFALLHYGKPPLEVVGSFIAGVVLAWMAIRSCSFLPGFACHALVSATMDVFVMVRS